MGVLFIHRPTGYKVGLLLVLVSVVCFLAGFSAPYWTVYSISHRIKGDGESIRDYLYHGDFQGHNGLWETCRVVPEFSARLCVFISHHHGYPGWMSGVQGFLSVGLAGLVISALYAAAVNFLWPKPVHNRYLEILLLLSGILGFTGCALYAAHSFGKDRLLTAQTSYFYNNNINNNTDNINTYTNIKGSQPYTIKKNELAWAFVIALTGSLLSIISSVLIYTQNRYVLTRQQCLRAAAAAGVSFTPEGNIVFSPPDYETVGCSSPPPPPPPYSPSPYSPSSSPSSPSSPLSAPAAPVECCGSLQNSAVVCEVGGSSGDSSAVPGEEEEEEQAVSV